MQIQCKSGRRWKMLASCIVVASLGSIAGYSQDTAVLYEGARLIVGDAALRLRAAHSSSRMDTLPPLARRDRSRRPPELLV